MAVLHAVLFVHLGVAVALAVAPVVEGDGRALLRAGKALRVPLRVQAPVPAPPPAPAPAIAKAPGVHWLATVKGHLVSKLTYGGDEQPLLVPNEVKPIPFGTPCMISVWLLPTETNACTARVVCGDRALFFGDSHACNLLTSSTRDRGKRTDAVLHARNGTCNGGTDVTVMTWNGTALLVTDNSYAGPSRETERLTLAIAGDPVADD
jgi:hypothetical protein